MEKQDYLVVVPSIRPLVYPYLDSLKEFDIFVADDSHGMVDRTEIVRGDYKDFGFYKIILGSDAFKDTYVEDRYLHIFPSGCPSVKDLGLFFAAKEGYKAVILVDDDVDTRISSPDSFMTIGKKTRAIIYANGSGWFNTLKLISGNQDIYARGYPYEYRGEHTELVAAYDSVLPSFNEGLWVGTPDINGIDKIQMDSKREYLKQFLTDKDFLHEEEAPWYISLDLLLPDRVLVRDNQNLPLSIMNCQIETRLVPAFYQPPDFQLYGGWRIRRHDDVWSMYFLKKVMDHFHLQCTVGAPLVWHRKAGDPITELLSEHNTNLIQGMLTSLLDEGALFMTGKSKSPDICDIAHAAYELAVSTKEMLTMENKYHIVLDDYLLRCAMWAKMFL